MLLRSLFNAYKSRIETRAAGDRALRESSTLRATESIWSDVASSMGLGFRFSDAGPLLHGDLSDDAQLRMGLYDTEEGAYRTLADVRFSPPPEGTLVVRPLDAVTRALRLFVGTPKAVSPELAAHFFVQASSAALAERLLVPRVQRLLLDRAERAPVFEYEQGVARIVLEGVELTHAHLEEIVATLTEIAAPRATPPYRG